MSELSVKDKSILLADAVINSVDLLNVYRDAYKEAKERITELEREKSAMEALAAENAGMKSGAYYFSYGSEHNFEWHKTAEEAIGAAEAAIDDYRGDSCDGWSEEVDSICWGIILQSSTKVGERPRNEDDRCDPAIDTICDYSLLPNIKTPATDAVIADIEARGVEKFSAEIADLAKCKSAGTAEILKSVGRNALAFAKRLRSGKGAA